jgi:hypothetical protein
MQRVSPSWNDRKHLEAALRNGACKRSPAGTRCLPIKSTAVDPLEHAVEKRFLFVALFFCAIREVTLGVLLKESPKRDDDITSPLASEAIFDSLDNGLMNEIAFCLHGSHELSTFSGQVREIWSTDPLDELLKRAELHARLPVPVRCLNQTHTLTEALASEFPSVRPIPLQERHRPLEAAALRWLDRRNRFKNFACDVDELALARRRIAAHRVQNRIECGRALAAKGWRFLPRGPPVARDALSVVPHLSPRRLQEVRVNVANTKVSV